MYRDKHQPKQEERETLEAFVIWGVGGYGAYILFKRLAARHPLQFIHFMQKHRGSTSAKPPDSADSHLPLAEATVNDLQRRLREYLVDELRLEQEIDDFKETAEKLEDWLIKQSEEN